MVSEKKMAGLAVAAGICLFIGYLFHTGYRPYAIQPHITEKAPSAPPVNAELLENNPKKTSPPAATQSGQKFKNTEQTLDRMIHPIVPTPQPEGQNIGLGYTPAGPNLDNHMDNYPDASKEPEPDAIIDWLLNKRKIE